MSLAEASMTVRRLLVEREGAVVRGEPYHAPRWE